ncbi:sensor histidine kinase [Niallia sp. NCCP-28]|uniref:sensor histidine kinase n=1 Tax=Niallia sp. NCCP-28 TaxID=2934712 RepID=UPI00208A233C|nr:sensor histidine kinase [Niallia sp. NCCP-28]GKU83142.1 sensor protein LytS [Niallia sp. NCCP-28]
MISLLPIMIERVGILVLFAFLLSRVSLFRGMIQKEREYNLQEKMLLMFIFGMFGIISNYTGVAIEKGSIISHSWQTNLEESTAIANTRIMGVAIGGLLGGPAIGFGVGFIAGLHRFTLGGFTSIACGISTIIAGLLTGLIGKKYRFFQNPPFTTVFICICMELLQMAIILLMAKPFVNAFELVSIIAAPMIIINGFGILIFIYLIQSILSEEEQTKAAQTEVALDIAQNTLPYFRLGLTPESSRHAAQIIIAATSAEAVAITNRTMVLTHIGIGSDHHIPLEKTETELTKHVLASGKIVTAITKKEIHCSHLECPLQAAIVLPLKANQKIVGTLKLYFTNPKNMGIVEYKLAEGLSRLFSMQLELAEAENQQKLLKDAEIKALQAQIHPHFLFNSMNTIAALIRTDRDKARRMVHQLSAFFRSNLQGSKSMYIPLKQELEHVDAFLALEKARFPDKFSLHRSIDSSLHNVLVPPFVLQPLIENTLRHAFSAAKKGDIYLTGYRQHDSLVLTVEDNGKGMSEELLLMIGNKTVQSEKGTGTALWNISKRIKELYGRKAVFLLESEPNRGTKIIIQLPIREIKQWGNEDVESASSGR